MDTSNNPTGVLPIRPTVTGEPEAARAKRIEDLICRAAWQFNRGQKRGGHRTDAGRMCLEQAWAIVNVLLKGSP